MGIQQVLKLAIRWTALKDIVDDTMVQLNKGAKPEKVVFVKKIGVVWDCSVSWLVNAYEAINNHELVEKVTQFLKYIKSLFLTKFTQAFKLCLVEKDGLNLSYECLTSKKARDTLAEQIAASPEFERSLQCHHFYCLVMILDSTHLFKTFFKTFILLIRLVKPPHVHMTYVYSFSMFYFSLCFSSHDHMAKRSHYHIMIFL